MKKKLFILIFVFVFLIGGAAAAYDGLGRQLEPEALTVHKPEKENTPADPQETAGQEETEGIPAPDFTVYDREGNQVKLSDYYGKPIVLNFWASWCGPCQMEMPDFHEKHQELGEEITFLMVNMTDGAWETVEAASAFVEEKAYAFPVLFDTGMDAAATYGVNSLPTTYFINADGYAIAQAMGAIDGEALQQGIDLIRG